eukprot:15363425-Ditylum_brightwellii.AAC.1
MMRKAGLKVDGTPKIHVVHSSVGDHSILFEDDGLRIPLELSGISSCFPMCKPSTEQFDGCLDDNSMRQACLIGK